MMKILTILVLTLTLSTVQGQPDRAMFHSANKSATAPPVIKDTVRINLSGTDQNVATMNDLFGPPHSGVRSIADLVDIHGTSTGIGITTIATANWGAYAGLTTNDPICCGVTGNSFYGASANNTTVAGSNMFNYGSVQPARYDAARPQFRFTGLDPSSTYEIKITSQDGNYGFEARSIFKVVGLTSPATIQVNGNTTNQSTGATFTIQPTSGGQIDIWCNSDPAFGGDLCIVPAIFITQQ